MALIDVYNGEGEYSYDGLYLSTYTAEGEAIAGHYFEDWDDYFENAWVLAGYRLFIKGHQ